MKKKFILASIMALLLLSSIVCNAVIPQAAPEKEPQQEEKTLAGPAASRTLAPTFTQTPTIHPTASITPTPTTTSTHTPQPTPTIEYEVLPRLHPATLPDTYMEPGLASADHSERPSLSGQAYSLGTTNFRIHYTFSGDDAVSQKDDNQNQIPDYVEETAKALEYVWSSSVDVFGWAPPPPDEGIGGDDRYDVYLMDVYNTDDAFGYTEGGYTYTKVGDNPNSEALETRSHYSFIALDNDYDVEPGYEYTALESLYSTAAHEFMHSLQFGYDGEEPADWLWEASAVWFQEELFNEINDANLELVSVFKSPDTCQLAYGGEERLEDEYHWYGMWIFMRYISEHYGHQAVRSIWENAVLQNGYKAIETTLNDLGTNLDDIFINYSLALLTRDFEEGADYPLVRLEGNTNYEDLFIPVDGVGQMGADYVEILADGIISIRLNTDHEHFMVAAGIFNQQLYVFNEINNEISLDADLFEHLYVLILNPEKAINEIECSWMPYTLNILPAGEANAWETILDAPNFEAPLVEGLEYVNDEPLDLTDIPEDIIPEFIPDAFYLSDAYQIFHEDLPQDDVDWYLPGDEPGWELLYDHDDGWYFDIDISNSPFSSMEDFYYFIGYEPLDEEIVFINNKQVMLFDFSDDSGPYYDATFIHNGKFYVVYGEMEYELFEQVIQGILKE